jgi:hypothetical protein
MKLQPILCRIELALFRCVTQKDGLPTRIDPPGRFRLDIGLFIDKGRPLCDHLPRTKDAQIESAPLSTCHRGVQQRGFRTQALIGCSPPCSVFSDRSWITCKPLSIQFKHELAEPRTQELLRQHPLRAHINATNPYPLLKV